MDMDLSEIKKGTDFALCIDIYPFKMSQLTAVSSSLISLRWCKSLAARGAQILLGFERAERGKRELTVFYINRLVTVYQPVLRRRCYPKLGRLIYYSAHGSTMYSLSLGGMVPTFLLRLVIMAASPPLTR